MKETAQFCKETISGTEKEIKSLKETIETNTDTEEFTEFTSTFDNYHCQNVSRLKKRIANKYRILNWNITQPVSSSTKGNKQKLPQNRQSQCKEEVQPQPQNQVTKQQPRVKSKPKFAEVLTRSKYPRRPRHTKLMKPINVFLLLQHSTQSSHKSVIFISLIG